MHNIVHLVTPMHRLVTPAPKGRVREIIASLQKASAERGHRPHAELPDASPSPNLELDHATQDRVNKGEFREQDLLQWVERVCGVRGGKGVCEGLLQLGVLEAREEGAGENGFSPSTTYCWKGQRSLLTSSYRLQYYYPMCNPLCLVKRHWLKCYTNCFSSVSWNGILL